MRNLKCIAVVACALALAFALTGCGGSSGSGSASASASAASESASSASASASAAAAGIDLADGTYIVDFNTDSSMFHANEADEGTGVLTVAGGEGTVHVRLASTKILNLYAGLAEDAQAAGAELLEPTVETVTYSDGAQEEVNAFDIPVPYLDDDFDVALIGEKGTWYDHKVSVSNPVAQ